MLCSDIPAPTFFIFSSSVPYLLYYSHIPATIVSLLLGFFVYFSNRSLVSKILCVIAVVFSLWTFLDLVVWTNINPVIITTAWSFFGILYSLLYILCLYFVYVFLDGKDISNRKKILLALLFLPVAVFSWSKYGIAGFDLEKCEVIEGSLYTNYYYFLGLFLFLWILAVIVNRYKKADKEFRKQIRLLGIGIGLFLFSFFVSGYLASLLDNFELEQYGLFGMTVFMGFLVYLIVRFRAFNVKLIGAQALVISLIVLIGSQSMIIQTTANRVLSGVTLLLSVVFGLSLIRSVKNEVRRKEELQGLTEKLAVANDQLRISDNARSEFISIASHQLKTPLGALKGYISMSKEGDFGEVGPQMSDALDKMSVINDRLLQLVENLLDVSRMESGRIEYDFKKASMENMLRELQNAFVLAARQKGLYLHFLYPRKSLPEIEMDAGKIREVASNLIDNALKYSKQGGVTVKLETIGNTARLIVSDSGIGIPPQEMCNLFSKFSRGKDRSRLAASGTGLGLYVTKNIIEAHHGKIWAESDGVGKGSRFIFEIPFAQPATPTT